MTVAPMKGGRVLEVAQYTFMRSAGAILAMKSKEASLDRSSTKVGMPCRGLNTRRRLVRS